MLILDIVSTDQGAFRLLRKRVLAVSKTYDNYIVCPAGEHTAQMRAENIDLIDFPQSRNLGLSLFTEIRTLYGILLKIKPDIVHSHNSKSGAVARIAANLYNRRSGKNIDIIHQVHGFHFNACSGLKRRFYQLVELWLARNSDELLFQNRHELQQAEDLGLSQHARFTYLGNGIDTELFSCDNNGRPKEPGPYRILCTARIEPVKNQTMLVEVARILATDSLIPNFQFILIGESDPDYLLQLTSLIKKYRLATHFKFTGMLKTGTLLDVMQDADMSLLPSIKEGKPRALMESMMFGLPCIATDVVGSNEVITDGKTGTLVPLNDAQAMADAIKSLMRDPEKARRYSIAAKTYASIHFDEQNVIQKLLSVYKRYETGVVE